MATTRKTTTARKRPTTKTAAKAPARPAAPAPAPTKAAKAPAKPAPKTAKPAKAPKADKPKKPKLVRDSFTIPKTEYAVLEQLKARAAKAGAPSKKSEVLRAGIKALAALPDSAFAAAMAAVPALKTGRPAKG